MLETCALFTLGPIQRDPSNEGDLRMWFQAYRRLPAFDVIRALSRLEGWAARADSIDAHYLLILPMTCMRAAVVA